MCSGNAADNPEDWKIVTDDNEGFAVSVLANDAI